MSTSVISSDGERISNYIDPNILHELQDLSNTISYHSTLEVENKYDDIDGELQVSTEIINQ